MFRILSICFLMYTGAILAETTALNLLDTHKEFIHTISSFEKMDYFSSFTANGEPAWERAFNSKILSWKVEGEGILIFSQERSGQTYYLTCFNRNTGEFLWEKGIYPPQET